MLRSPLHKRDAIRLFGIATCRRDHSGNCSVHKPDRVVFLACPFANAMLLVPGSVARSSLLQPTGADPLSPMEMRGLGYRNRKLCRALALSILTSASRADR